MGSILACHYYSYSRGVVNTLLTSTLCRHLACQTLDYLRNIIHWVSIFPFHHAESAIL